MKKIAVVLIVFLIILSGVKYENDFTLLNYFSGEYVVYTSEDVEGSGVDLGFCYMNTEPVKNHVVGESVKVRNLEVGKALSTLNARVVNTEYLENDLTVIYAYTNLIKEKVEVSGNLVNLQIAMREDYVIIGWPLILGSY